MALAQTKYIERVLIALNQDGTFKAAHQETLSEVRDGNTILAATYDTEPLQADALASVLPNVAGLMAQIEALKVAKG